MPATYSDFVPYYDEYKHKVFSFLLYRLNGDRMLAEDLTSDVFVRAYEKFETYNPQYAFSTWIYTVARNLLIDYWRKHEDTLEIEQAEDVPDKLSVTATEKLNRRERLEKIYTVLGTLPSFQKDCIILKYLEGMSTKHIAEVTGESEANVRQAISRGTRKIKGYASLFFVFFCLLITL